MLTLAQYENSNGNLDHKSVALRAEDVELLFVDSFTNVHYFRIMFDNAEWRRFTYARLPSGNFCAHDGKGKVYTNRSSVFYLNDAEFSKVVG